MREEREGEWVGRREETRHGIHVLVHLERGARCTVAEGEEWKFFMSWEGRCCEV